VGLRAGSGPVLPDEMRRKKVEREKVTFEHSTKADRFPAVVLVYRRQFSRLVWRIVGKAFH